VSCSLACLAFGDGRDIGAGGPILLPDYLANTTHPTSSSPLCPKHRPYSGSGKWIRHLPHVNGSQNMSISFCSSPAKCLAASSGNFATGTAQTIGSADGLFLQTGPCHRRPRPDGQSESEDEFVTDEKTAQAVGWHVARLFLSAHTPLRRQVHHRVVHRGPTYEQTAPPFNATLVGIVVFNNDRCP